MRYDLGAIGIVELMIWKGYVLYERIKFKVFGIRNKKNNKRTLN
jgi:hypothetical protein